MDNATKLLPLTEINEHAQASIVLIHGAFDNSTTWTQTAVGLPDYHLLIPDLPGHGRARQHWPEFSLRSAGDEIARVIQHKGKNGKARIVGGSLGAHVALDVLTRFPDIVEQDALLLGLNYWPEINKTLFSRLGWLATRLSNLVKKSSDLKTADGAVLPPMPYPYWKEVGSIICSDRRPCPWPARTMILAAGKHGGAPVTDRASTARMLRDVGHQANAETAAYWNADLIHAWMHEQGQLCAQMIIAWIERRPLPDGFVLLD